MKHVFPILLFLFISLHSFCQYVGSGGTDSALVSNASSKAILKVKPILASISDTATVLRTLISSAGISYTNLYHYLTDSVRLRDSIVANNGVIVLRTITGTDTLYTLQTDTSVIRIPSTSFAQGDIAYYNGSGWARLSAGTSGQYLQTQGSGANPVWAPASLATEFVSNANYTIQTTDGYIFLPKTSTQRTLTIPAASTMQNQRLVIHNWSSSSTDWIVNSGSGSNGSYIDQGSQQSTTGGTISTSSLTTIGSGAHYEFVSVLVQGTWQWALLK